MADFCKQCSIVTFGEDYGDLTNAIGVRQVLCEGCGPTTVASDGRCIQVDCLVGHGKDLEPFHIHSPVRLAQGHINAGSDGKVLAMDPRGWVWLDFGGSSSVIHRTRLTHMDGEPIGEFIPLFAEDGGHPLGKIPLDVLEVINRYIGGS